MGGMESTKKCNIYLGQGKKIQITMKQLDKTEIPSIQNTVDKKGTLLQMAN